MISNKMLSFGTKDCIHFEVIGDSMDNGKRHSFHPGDTIMVSEIPKRMWIKLLKKKGNVYVFATKTGIYIKEVVDFDEQTKAVTCRSWNPSPEYSDFKLWICQIEKIYCIDVVNRNLEENPRLRASA